jgi:hypothetical protein
MKNGDKIKAFVKIGLMKNHEWRRGSLIASNRNLDLQELKNLGFQVRVKHEDEYLVEVSGNRLILTAENVRLWEPLPFVRNEKNEYTCQKHDEFVKSNWDRLKEHCKTGVKNFFPEVVLTINDEEKTISVEDKYGPYLTVSAGVMEKKSIVRFFEVPTWEIVLWIPTIGTRWEPPDVEEKNCGQSETTIGAARLLVDNIWRLRTEDYWQSLQDSELAEGEQW